MRTQLMALFVMGTAFTGCELVTGLSDLEFAGGGGAGAGENQGAGPATSDSSTSSNQGGASSASTTSGLGGSGGGDVLPIEALYNENTRHTCARRGSDVLCFGQGVGTEPDMLSPQLHDFVPSTVEPAASSYNHCARDVAGEIHCWGTENEAGQLGFGDTTTQTTPGPAVLVPNPAVDLSFGGNQGCAIAGPQPHEVYCWGANDYAMIAFPGDALPHATPIQVDLPSNGETIDQIGMGHYHMCARAGTAVTCWGKNQYGAIGNGNEDFEQYSPTPLATAAAAVELAVTGDGGCIMTSTGEALCWGGSFGGGGAVLPWTALDGAAGIDGGQSHVCGIRNGDVVCIGSNDEFQLGFNDVTIDVNVVDLPSGASQVVAGYEMTCALTVDNKVYCWGSNYAGALGVGSPDENSFGDPQQVNFPP